MSDADLLAESRGERQHPIPEASPVKYVTVTTSKFVIKDHCGSIERTTYLMPLMELYDELCKREDRDDSDTYTAEEQEQFFLKAEQQFAKKYGLTLKQVGLIKREGSRIKYGMGTIVE